MLTEGTYWIEIQANMDFATQGEWGWTDRTVQSNSPAAWQNPGGGFGVCPTWAPKLAVCIPTAGGPDQVYRINGTGGGGGTPSPTPTGTPAGCSTYTTSTGTGTITPGDTDTGNHCDDCATEVTPPFPLTVYGQTFSTINVASNGSLDLTGTEAPFTHGCQVLPNTSGKRPFSRIRTTCAQMLNRVARLSLAETVAFSLPQRVLRLTVTSSLNGAQFTLLTSLRQPTLKWCFTRTTRLTLTSFTAQLRTTA